MEKESWALTYNLIWCVITIPTLGFLIRYLIKNLERKIESICKGLDVKRSKEMCDEKMKAVTIEQTRLTEAMTDLWERVNHHKHQKENGGILI